MNINEKIAKLVSLIAKGGWTQAPVKARVGVGYGDTATCVSICYRENGNVEGTFRPTYSGGIVHAPIRDNKVEYVKVGTVVGLGFGYKEGHEIVWVPE